MFLCFETIKLVDGELLNLEYHQKRLDKSRKAFGYDERLSLKEYLKELPKEGTYRVRVDYGESFENFTYKEYKQRDFTSFKVINAEIDYKFKYVNREELKRAFEQKNGCDDVIIIQNDEIKDTTIANIALLINNQWYTPIRPLLEGTTRNRLIKEGFLKEQKLDINSIKIAQKFAIMNALLGFTIIENIRIDF